MKYAIYGAGSLGLVVAAFLANAKEEFTLIDRNIKNITKIQNDGIKITGTIEMKTKVKAQLDSEVEDKFDLVMLFTKQIDNLATINKIAKMLNPNGVICTMQNGLPEKDVASVIGEERTYGCAVGWGATRLQYGVSELTSVADKESLTFGLGTLGLDSLNMLKEISRILNIMGTVEIEPNFIGARYVKLLINAAFSGMSTVCGATFGEVAKNKSSRKIIQLIIKECIDVAKAKNIKIEPIQGKDVVKLLDYHNAFKKYFGFKIIPLAIKKHANLKASMLQDIEKGLPCEIESINMLISQLGKEVKVPTPYNDKVVEIIKKEEAGELKPSFSNIQLFY